jgi:3-phenylpropionate/trans-cinnamate dioxygenase ferredoxin reductase subunit
MVLGRRIVAVRPEQHVALADDGAEYRYSALIWATGGAPRPLACPGNDLSGVCYLRTRADVDRIKEALAGARRVVVIGGGYIGLEVSAIVAQAGKAVTLLVSQDRVLSRVAGEPLSRFFEAEHRAHGVNIRLGVQVARIERPADSLLTVHLTDGEIVSGDLAIVGVGILPTVHVMIDAGGAGANGIEVDSYCRTGLPDVYAIGDCAAQASPFAEGRMIRIESVQNAHDQATTVAKFLTGAPERHSALPVFWSCQYDLRLQTVGLSTGYDQTIVRGDPGARSFSVIYMRRGKVIALDCVNAMKDYVQGRALVANGAKLDAAALSDSARPLKELALAD